MTNFDLHSNFSKMEDFEDDFDAPLGDNVFMPPDIPMTISLSIIIIIPIVLRLLAALASNLLKRRCRRSPHRQGAANNRPPNNSSVSPNTPSPYFSPGTHYGLAVGEAGDDHSDSDTDDDITTRELRRLEQTAAFQLWCRSKGMTLRDLEATSSRLTLYRRLRALHPASFWLLCRADTRTGLETFDPSIALLAVEYIFSTAITVASLGAVVYCAIKPVEPIYWALCAVGVWAGCLRSWMGGRPTAGPAFNVWYSDLEWGHRASSGRCIAASLLEGVYVAGTLGIGAIISLGMRCCGTAGQSVCERIAGVKVVVERRVRLDEE